ncbi:MAG: hypothetical protein EGR93_11800 [Prevotella sp.]|nr:hypothetical protein [Prevotella sp.]
MQFIPQKAILLILKFVTNIRLFFEISNKNALFLIIFKIKAYKPGLEKKEDKKRYNPKSNEDINTLNYKNKHFIFRYIQQLSTINRKMWITL